MFCLFSEYFKDYFFIIISGVCFLFVLCYVLEVFGFDVVFFVVDYLYELVEEVVFFLDNVLIFD